MEMNLRETSGIRGFSESDHKMTVFLDITSCVRFTILLIAAAVSSVTLVYVQVNRLPTMVHNSTLSSKFLWIHWIILKFL
jgi:hypothetical protein